MSQEEHRKMVDAVRQEKQALVARFREEFEDLERVERFHAKLAGLTPDGDLPAERPLGFYEAQVELSGAHDPQAAVWALKKIGRKATPSEIIDLLRNNGYKPDRTQKQVSDGIRQALGRKEYRRLFKKVGHGEYDLVERRTHD